MYTASEKLAIIRPVENPELSIRRTLTEINVSRSSLPVVNRLPCGVMHGPQSGLYCQW